MNIYLTLDYEIYFGENHGTVEKCIINPVNKLREISNKTGVKMTFFIDVGHIIRLKYYSNKFSELKNDYEKLIANISSLVKEGHDCQLHIHPHWENSIYNGKKWIFDHSKYKLVDFNEQEIERIFQSYKEELENITRKKVTSFRAGGWCLQPFDKIKPSFLNNKIKIDSSVFPGGKSTNEYYYYDFTNTPQKSEWNFDNDLCKDVKNGPFLEMPISSYKYSAIFFWKLFLLGNLFPESHKPLGDGRPMPTKGNRRSLLTKGGYFSANLEGYFCSKLIKIIKLNEKNNYNSTVVLGHPKALTNYSIKKLEQVIIETKTNYNYKRFCDIDI